MKSYSFPPPGWQSAGWFAEAPLLFSVSCLISATLHILQSHKLERAFPLSTPPALLCPVSVCVQVAGSYFQLLYALGSLSSFSSSAQHVFILLSFYLVYLKHLHYNLFTPSFLESEKIVLFSFPGRS